MNLHFLLDNIELYLANVLILAAVMAIVGWIWLVIGAFREGFGWGLTALFPPTWLVYIPFKWQRAHKPLLLLSLAVLVGLLPYLMAEYHKRYASFGPREKIVDGELHITLTGWDGKDYNLLADRPDVVVLQMANKDVDDETLKIIANLKELKELDLTDSTITDEGLAILASLPQLRDLRLARTNVTEEGFQKHLAEKDTLMNVDLRGTKVASKTLRAWKEKKENRNFLR